MRLQPVIVKFKIGINADITVEYKLKHSSGDPARQHTVAYVGVDAGGNYYVVSMCLNAACKDACHATAVPVAAEQVQKWIALGYIPAPETANRQN